MTKCLSVAWSPLFLICWRFTLMSAIGTCFYSGSARLCLPARTYHDHVTLCRTNVMVNAREVTSMLTHATSLRTLNFLSSQKENSTWCDASIYKCIFRTIKIYNSHKEYELLNRIFTPNILIEEKSRCTH